MTGAVLDYGAVQERLNHLLDTLPEAVSGKVLRIVPVAAPVIDVMWRVLETHTEPVGLVERYILRAVSILGPATPEKLDDILQLGVDRVRSALSGLQNCGAPLRLSKGAYELTVPNSELQEALELRRDIEHERGFVANGLCDQLLPVSFWDDHGELRLRPNVNVGDVVADASGRGAMVHHLLHPSNRDGRTAIEACLLDDGCQEREALGIPDGMSRLLGELPVRQDTSWVLAFLLVLVDSQLRIFSAGRSHIEFGLPEKHAKDCIEAACPALKSHETSCDLTFDRIAGQKRVQPWPKASEFVAATGTLYVSLPNPEEEMQLPSSMVADSLDPDVKVPWYCRSLVFGRCWTGPGQWVLLRVLPGDTATAARVCSLAGALELRRFVLWQDVGSITPTDLSDWWHVFQQEFSQRLPDGTLLGEVDMEAALAGARQIKDSEFQEKLSTVMRRSRVVRERTAEHPGQCVLTNAPGLRPALGEQVLDLIRCAQDRIALTSPMVCDQRIANAIVAARMRGVEVLLLTELFERKHGRAKFPTKGFEFEPSKAVKEHFENVRKLARHGILCRSMDFYMHAKLLMVDNNVAVISSANLSSNSLGWGREPAYEAGMLIVHSHLVEGIGLLFDALWRGSPYQLHRRLRDIDLVEERGVSLPAEMLCQKAGETRIALSMPPDRFAVLDELVAAFRRASKTILIVCMSCYELEAIPTLGDALMAALGRGVSVVLVVRAGFWGKATWPDKGIEKLMRMGMQVRCTAQMHVKGLVIDGIEGAVLSANINPYSLSYTEPSANIEIGLFGRNGEAPWHEWCRLLDDIARNAEDPFRCKSDETA